MPNAKARDVRGASSDTEKSLYHDRLEVIEKDLKPAPTR
jgi:hypothetical protein